MKRFAMILLVMLLLACCACAFAEGGAERTAAPYNYALTGSDHYVENLVFNGDVIISGDDCQIIFANCQFNGDIINTAETYTRVLILPDCEVNGRFVLRNSIREATIETALPKFISYVPTEVIAEDCGGAMILAHGDEIIFNGETFTMADSQYYYAVNPEAGFVPYDGQEANIFMVGRWWENGEEVKFVYCEYDPNT